MHGYGARQRNMQARDAQFYIIHVLHAAACSIVPRLHDKTHVRLHLCQWAENVVFSY